MTDFYARYSQMNIQNQFLLVLNWNKIDSSGSQKKAKDIRNNKIDINELRNFVGVF